jgi:hypothetical protein
MLTQTTPNSFEISNALVSLEFSRTFHQSVYPAQAASPLPAARLAPRDSSHVGEWVKV